MLHSMIASAMLALSAPSEVQVTVYNGGFALVKENRSFELKSGTQELTVNDVAERIEPTSVAIKSISSPGSFKVLEQNYKYDLISVQAILQKSVGQTIQFNRILPDGRREILTGKLLSAPTSIVNAGEQGGFSGQGGFGGQGSYMTYNGMVVQMSDGKIFLNPTGEVMIDKIPNGLISTPSLMWMVEASQAGLNKVELSYITQGMSWKADYVLSLEKDGTGGDLKGWVTMDNQSGAKFENATLKLLAGEVKRPQPEMQRGGFGGGGFATGAVADKGFVEETFADYHLYSLQRKATINNKETKQLSLIEAFSVPVTKKLVVDSMANFPNYLPNEGHVGEGELHPEIQYEIKNDEKSNLGMPLPAGNFKIYQRDSSGSVQLLGEDTINHTPRNEIVNLTVGKAFDIVSTRTRKSFEWISTGHSSVREMFEIYVRNRKTTTETITILERHWGDWKVTKESIPSTKPDSETIQYLVVLRPDETKTITYTVETYW